MSGGQLRLELEEPGRHFGELRIPHSRDDSAWGTLCIPVVAVIGRPGPTVLMTGASHGDELEGPILLSELARQLDPNELTGRVLIVPAMNVPALQAGRRLSPVDGKNLNRVFPGDPAGSLTERIAAAICRELVPLASVVLDIHAGGQSLDFLPTAVVHRLDDPQLMDRTLGALRAFAAPIGLVLHELDSAGLLDTEVERLGKVFVSTELGGGARVSPRSLEVGRRGIINLLRHAAVLPKKPEIPQPTRLLTVPDADAYVTAEHDGLFEPRIDLGSSVDAGQQVARVHRIDQPQLTPTVHEAPTDGVVVCLRAKAATTRGDCLVVLAEPYEG